MNCYEQHYPFPDSRRGWAGESIQAACTGCQSGNVPPADWYQAGRANFNMDTPFYSDTQEQGVWQNMPAGGQTDMGLPPMGIPPLGARPKGNHHGQVCIDPSRFPVGMAYVPVQQWSDPYELETGFFRGTIFKDLDLPFLAGRCQ